MTKEEIAELIEALPQGLDADEFIYRLVNWAVDIERNKVAKWMMDKGYATGHGDSVIDLLKELEWQVAEREREACAKLCEKERNDLLWREGQTLPQGEPRLIHMANTAGHCAQAIRARSEK